MMPNQFLFRFPTRSGRILSFLGFLLHGIATADIYARDDRQSIDLETVILPSTKAGFG